MELLTSAVVELDRVALPAIPHTIVFTHKCCQELIKIRKIIIPISSRQTGTVF
jgi:hypothetical protein